MGADRPSGPGTAAGRARRGPDASPPEGVVFNVQRFSVHDGPGIRTTVFLKGCPLSCIWCHNPEGRDPDPELSLLPGRCIDCGDCVDVCPEDAARPASAAETVSGTGGNAGATERETGGRARCVRCGACAEVCPAGARVMLGRTWTVAGLLDEVERDRPFYEESGGGVTFSGGEPLLPPRNAAFTFACLRAAGDRGLHRAVDTSGQVPAATLAEIAPHVDLFLYDLKHMDDTTHRRLTGVGNERILENLALLDRQGAAIRIRIPLVPGVNDDAAHLEALASFLRGLRTRPPVHLLPYHRVGGEKYRRRGAAYTLDHVVPPDDIRVRAVADRLRETTRLEVCIGG